MARRGMNFFEQHFFFSNKLVQLIFGLRSDQNSQKQLFIVCAVTIYVLPVIGHQVSVSLHVETFDTTIIIVITNNYNCNYYNCYYI